MHNDPKSKNSCGNLNVKLEKQVLDGKKRWAQSISLRSRNQGLETQRFFMAVHFVRTLSCAVLVKRLPDAFHKDETSCQYVQGGKAQRNRSNITRRSNKTMAQWRKRNCIRKG